MTYEDLVAKYEGEIEITEHSMINKGLYGDNVVWIRKDLTDTEKKCILAEEIGHCRLTVGDITDQHDINNQRQELKARVWAYNQLLSIDRVIDAAGKGYTQPHEMAEYLEVDEQFLRDYLKHQGIINISL